MKANFMLSNGDRTVTDADGKVKVTLKGAKTGAHTVTASMVGGKSKQLVVNFTADTLTAQISLNVTEDNFIADNIGMTRLQATVADGNGNLVEGIKINFCGTSVTLSSTSVKADDQVFAEILVTSTEVGLKTVSASLADKPTEAISRLLSAKIDVGSAATTSQEILEGQVMVVQDIVVKAHVNDQFGNPMVRQPTTFSAAPSPQMIVNQNTVSTNAQGVAEVTMTPGRNGSYTVKASLANGASLGKQLEATDEKLTLTSSPFIGVNAPKSTILTAMLTSANGTPTEGQVINFSVTLEGATLSDGKAGTGSLGQAPVVLTNDKVSTYTVTASFHNGVIVQTQTIVEITGNPSTAHIISFIAEPSTTAVTNSGLSTLKTTVEDGSGNLVEGLTVYFTLKNGSTTLTPLTAVTDQNGVATTSMRGAITGNITVSIVTNADGIQTVNISLVAGLADTSQSILENNQSSLRRDFTDSAELHLVLHDISGNPIKVSEGMEFVQPSISVPYMKISTTDYTQDIDSDCKATITGGEEGIAALIPVLNGIHQADLSTTVEFTNTETRPITGTVSANGTDLPTASFPSQGFTRAYYQLNNDNLTPGKTTANYSFQARPLG